MCVFTCVWEHMYTGVYVCEFMRVWRLTQCLPQLLSTEAGYSLNPELSNSVTLAGYLVSGKPCFTFKALESHESCCSSLCCHSELQSSRLHSEHFTQGAVFLAWFESLYRFSSTSSFPSLHPLANYGVLYTINY